MSVNLFEFFTPICTFVGSPATTDCSAGRKYGVDLRR
jgi:hypothetical protein